MTNKTHIWHSAILFALLLITACAGQQPASQSPSAISTAMPTITVATAASAATSAATATGQAAIPVTSTDAPAVPTRGGATSTAASCKIPAELTPSMTEGPYFKAGSPAQANLAQNLPGTKLTLTGYVFTTDCQPVPNALLDFWQADSRGQYDNSGYTLRGHITTDAAGRYQIETIVPGLYPGRTEHIHVKVQAPGGPILTTQLFFPGVQQNQEDGIFDQRLLVTIQGQNGSMNAAYNFVVTAK